MKLKYKPDNEILDVVITSIPDEITVFCPEKLAKTINFHDYEWHYDSVEAFNKDWEDYEEPKEDAKGSALDLMIITLTNFIENEPDEDKVDLEDCKQMLNKFKAWKRLKDKGFRFNFWYGGSKKIDYEITSLENETYIPRQICDDLDLLFGGEE